MDFKDIKSIDELLDRLRRRFGMYASNISELNGIIIGYYLFSDKSKKDKSLLLKSFQAYLSKINKVKSNVEGWTKQIRDEASDERYEIPLFYKYLDTFRGIEYEELFTIILTDNQRYTGFQYRNKMNMDYPYKPLIPPYKFKIMLSKYDNLYYLFYYDKFDVRVNEQSFENLNRVKNLIKEVFSIELDLNLLKKK